MKYWKVVGVADFKQYQSRYKVNSKDLLKIQAFIKHFQILLNVVKLKLTIEIAEKLKNELVLKWYVVCYVKNQLHCSLMQKIVEYTML